MKFRQFLSLTLGKTKGTFGYTSTHEFPKQKAAPSITSFVILKIPCLVRRNDTHRNMMKQQLFYCFFCNSMEVEAPASPHELCWNPRDSTMLRKWAGYQTCHKLKPSKKFINIPSKIRINLRNLLT